MKYHIEFDLDFRRNPYEGRYIAIEGIDGSGKTTQVEKIGEYLKSLGKSVVATGEPRKSGGVFSKLIHDILFSKIKIPPVFFQYLFSADRAAHHQELVIPALKEGKMVLSDRCFWSAVPYGISDLPAGRQVEEGLVEEAKVLLVSQGILSMYHQFIVPDFTFYLKVSVDVAVKRIGLKKKVKEIYEKREKLEKIVAGYEWLVGQFPKEIMVIDGERPVEEVTGEIISKLPIVA